MRFIGAALKALVTTRLLVIVWLATSAYAQDSLRCLVRDPELQGAYTGDCRNGLAEGYGEARGEASYAGEFKAGRKHGKGVKSWPSSGDRYEGYFVDDRKEGTGMYVWGRGSASPGERYTGGYVADRRHGYGVYEWPNGDRYAGPWENDAVAGTPTKGMITRAMAQVERAAAVGRPGARVCREMRVGVASVDMVRATVLAREGDSIRVRIDNAGQFEHTLGDRQIKHGDVISDAMRFWVPCT
jgi:hypothetical protein